jgi:ATP-dependent Clp protease ATP-binding subunit ClpX
MATFKNQYVVHRIDTKNILFVMSGAFSGLPEIIQRRLNQQPLGFQNIIAEPVDNKDNQEIFKKVRSEDLIKFGFESEFVGRLPVVFSLNDLNVDGLYRILKNPNSTVILGKKRDFEAYAIDINFEDDALFRVAELAHLERTGARGLVSVVDRVLLKYEKMLPDTDITDFVVTKDVIDNPEHSLNLLITNFYIKSFQKKFLASNSIVITFTKGAIELLINQASAEGKTLDVVCSNLLRDYEYGLRLLKWDEFTVDEEIVKNPKERLEELIKKAYEKK